MIFLRKKKPCTIYSLALVDLSLDHCSDTGSWRKRSCSELEAKKQTYEYIWSDRASWDCCEHLKQRIYSNMATIRIMYHVLISKGSCTYVTWCVTRSWCWRCECVCGSQGLARCAPAGSAWRCPAVLPRAWLCSLWDRGRLSQAWTWSWWATATACRWWRRGLPQENTWLAVLCEPWWWLLHCQSHNVCTFNPPGLLELSTCYRPEEERSYCIYSVKSLIPMMHCSRTSMHWN